MTTLHEAPRPAKRPVAKPKKETKAQRAARLKKARAAKLQLRQRLLSQDPDAVLTFKEWCSLCGHSERVGRDIIKSDSGPVVTALSDRRLGISRRSHRDWLDKRAVTR